MLSGHLFLALGLHTCRCDTPGVFSPAGRSPRAAGQGSLVGLSRCSSKVEAESKPQSASRLPAGRVPGLQLSSVRPPSTLSQNSIASPQYRLLASPTCSSLGTLTRSSTVLSSFPSPRAASPAPLSGVSPGAGKALHRHAGPGSSGSSLLADIKNLKRELESPEAGSTGARAQVSTWAAAPTSCSASSMQSLDASLQRLAKLTGGLAGLKF